MRWFQINKDSNIFNLANITHFRTEEQYDKYRVVAYFNFSTRGGGVGIGGVSTQHRMEIGFSGEKEACEKIIKDIIKGTYDVPLDKVTQNTR